LVKTRGGKLVVENSQQLQVPDGEDEAVKKQEDPQMRV